MIQSNQELIDTSIQIETLYKAIEFLLRETAEATPQAFWLLAEGPMNEILQIKMDIENYKRDTMPKQEQNP